MSKSYQRVLLDGLSFTCFTLLVFIAIVGGGEFTVRGARVSLHNPRNPAIGLALFLTLRWLVSGGAPLCDGLPVRTLSALARRITRWIPRPSGVHLGIAILLYCGIMGSVVVQRHRSFHSHAYDLGIFDQLLWSVASGHGLYSSILDRHFLGQHFSPVLYGLSPLYWIWSSPITLLWTQTVLLALGAVPVWLYARHRMGNASWALLFACCYLAYQPLRNLNVFDFHEIALVTPLLLYAFWWATSGRTLAMLMALGLCLLCKEEAGAIVCCFGLYLMLVQRRVLLGTMVAALGAAVFLSLILWIIPSIRRDEYAFLYRYGYLGGSFQEMFRTLLTKPLFVLGEILTRRKFVYVLELIGPYLGLPLANPAAMLPGLATFLQNILSDYPYQYSIRSQYAAPLIPFMAFSAIGGMARLRNPVSRIGRWLFSHPRYSVGEVAFAWLLLCGLGFAGKPPLAWLREFQPPENDGAIRLAMTMIPDEAAVSAQTHLVPHLSQRRVVRMFPDYEGCEYIFLDRKGHPYPFSPDEYQAKVSSLPFEKVETVLDQSGVLLLRFRLPPTTDH